MTIKEFIQREVLLPRLRQASVLVVYDQEQRYRELCLELASDSRQVIDVSQSSIMAREAAMGTLQMLGQQNQPISELLIYVPSRAPRSDEEKQRDPYALYSVCGAIFPDPNKDGEEYLSLCLRAKADYSSEIRRIFQDDPNPNFAVIDAVGRGTNWPTLQTLLGVDSAHTILLALLAPSERQQTKLKDSDGWVSEAKTLFQTTLGLKLITRAKTWGSIADELWRFVLFSEFIFDLPTELPSSLAMVPRASNDAQQIIEDLCETLRNDQRNQEHYIRRAEEIESSLKLIEACGHIEDLGIRDTFPFEERSFFTQAIDALKRDNADRLRTFLSRHTHSIWSKRGENQAQWQLIQSAWKLIECCQDADQHLADQIRSQASLIDYYITRLHDVDRLQREFEQTAGDYIDPDGNMDLVRTQTRSIYQRLMGKVHSAFMRHLEHTGWPPPGRLANIDVFDRVVAPRLHDSGRRVALLLIDALRYELGVELQKHLVDGTQSELQAAFVQLPSITTVGMASLLPDASQHLRLVRKNDAFIPHIGDQQLTTVTQRMDVLRKRYGQRFIEYPLNTFFKNKQPIDPSVDLLVLRSNEMDNQFENTPETAPSQITRTFRRIVGAIQKLRSQGFQDVIVVADHGFYLNTAAEAGDVCAKPSGTWISSHDRILLGNGTPDSNNLVLAAEHLGIRGDFNQVAIPRALVAYRAGLPYFHGGVSLQEGIVPVLTLRLTPTEQGSTKYPDVMVRYKQGAKKITTRLPVLTIEVGMGDMFWGDQSFEVLLEAHDKQGNIVGEARPGGAVNPATRTITLQANESVPVTLRMDDNYEGKVSVKVIDPTTLTVFHAIDLETDYTV